MFLQTLLDLFEEKDLRILAINIILFFVIKFIETNLNDNLAFIIT